MRETGSTSAAPPATSTATNPRQHRPKDLNNTWRDIHLVETKYYEDNRPQNQLNAATEQTFAKFSKEPLLLSTSSFLGVGVTIYNTHTLKPFKELGLDSQR